MNKASVPSQKLPYKQQLVLEYEPKLKELVKAYPRMVLWIKDQNLSVNSSDLFEKVGFFIALPKVDIPMNTLVREVRRYLAEGSLVLLHYQPQSTNYNLIKLLRLIKKDDAELSLKGLIPIFMMPTTSQKQFEIFRLLGMYDINYASFLPPNVSAEMQVKELLKDLYVYTKKVLNGESSFAESSTTEKLPGTTEEKIREYQRLVAQGEKLKEKGNFEEAIEVFSKAIALNPNFDALMDRGDTYFSLKQYFASLKDYREANKLESSSFIPYSKIGSCCLQLAKSSVKEEEGRKSKKLIAMGLKHLKEAEKKIDLLVEMNKEYPDKLPPFPYETLVGALIDTDIRGLGIEDMEKEVTEFSTHIIEKTIGYDFFSRGIPVEVRIDQALLLARNKHYEKAEKIFRQVIEEDPDQVAPAFNNFAIELRKNGDPGKAFEIYAELLEYEIPDKSIVLQNFKKAGIDYGARLRENFQTSEAQSVYQKILQYRPNGREWVLCELAMAYLEEQNQAQASCFLMEAIYVNPSLMSLKAFDAFEDLRNLRAEMLKKLMG